MTLKDGAFHWTTEDMQFLVKEAFRRLGSRRKGATKRNVKREIGRVVRRFLTEKLASLPSSARATGLQGIDAQVEWFQEQVEGLGK